MTNDIEQTIFTPERRQQLMEQLRATRELITFIKKGMQSGTASQDQLNQAKDNESKILRIMQIHYPGQPTI